MLSQGDPNEPKMKSRIVDEMLPLLKDIPDSIEREAYAQEIALTLGLDPRTLLDRLRAMDRAQTIRSRAAVHSTQERRPPSDLETHILTVLMHYPELWSNVNALLAQSDVAPLSEDDFASQYRLIWASWVQMLEHPELELEDFLPSDMLDLVQDWVKQALPDMSPSQWERDLMRTVVRIRDKRLREALLQSQIMLRSASAESDLDAISRINQRIVTVSGQLRKIQWALAQRPARI